MAASRGRIVLFSVLMIAVTGRLPAHAPSIGLSRTSLSFSTSSPFSPPASQSVVLVNTTHGRMPWTATVTRGGNWLGVSPGSGVLPGTSLYEWVALGVSVSPASLATGVYYGTITVSAPGDSTTPPADNTPQTIEVTLTVGNPAPQPRLSLSPASLTLSATANSGRDSSTTFQVANSGGGTMNWTVATETSRGGNWLAVSPSSGTNSAVVSATARVGDLRPGTYTGRIVLSSAGVSNSPLSIAVTFRVNDALLPTLRLSTSTLNFSALEGTISPPPQGFEIRFGGEGSPNWRLTVSTASGGLWLNATPVSGGGTGIVAVSADLGNLARGTYTGTITVTADGAASSPSQVFVAFTVRAPQPTFDSARGVVNAATFLAGFLAPGEILTIFGSSLGPRDGVVAAPDPLIGKLPTTLAGTRVSFDGVPAPLFYVGQGQVNLQVPFEVAGKSAVRMVVNVEGLDPADALLPVREASPGIFTLDGTRAAALNQDFSLNLPVNPAPAGSVIQLFLTGQGVLDTPVETGAAAPVVPPFPAPLLPVIVSIDGVSARVLFSGLAPGFVGLMQLNVEIPLGVRPSSDAGVVVLVGTHPTGRRATIAVR